MRPASFDPERENSAHSGGKTLKDLARYLWPSGRWDLKSRLIFALFFLVGAKIINIYVPYLLKLIIDDFTILEGSDLQQTLFLPVALIMGYGAARVGVSLFGEFRDLLFIKVVQHAQRAVGLHTFQHLHALSLDFHLSRQTGGLSRIIQRGTRGIQFVLRFLTFNIVPTLLEIGLVTAVLVYKFDYIYAVIILITIALYIGLTLSVTEWRLKYRKTMNAEESRANTSAIDSLLNYETVKYFGNEEHEHKRFDQFLANYETAAIQSQFSLSLLNVLQTLIIGGGLVAIMMWAGQGVVDGTMTVGDFVLVNTYMIQLYLPLNFLGFVYREVKNSLVDMEKMFELADVKSSVTDRPDAQEISSQPMSVEFKNVHFQYNNDRSILNGVSFKIPAGKHLAIVGASGAGKSTISRLLFRFYDVSDGAILVGDKDIRDLSQKSLRAQIGVVPQDTVLFNDTIGYNINYGNPEATDIVSAASHAQIHNFIQSLPKGYETPVGERGLKLSGGERQRVAIARAILKKPQILIFDEATSSLDSHTEQEILGALTALSKNYTTLTIAHRLSTVVHVDEIIVLQDGKIEERGTHSELLNAHGLYKSMWDEQVKEHEET